MLKIIPRNVLLLASLVCCKLSILAMPMADDQVGVTGEDNRDFKKLSEDPEIMKIANREYETVHGRILAVNMATLGKRWLEMKRGTENSFENIEKINEGQHLNLYQGDIQLDKELEEYLHMPVRTETKRSAIRQKKRIWSSKIIPYRIPAFMSDIRQNVFKAIAEFHKHTCLRFVPYRPGVHKNYLNFRKSFGCSSKVGKRYAEAGAQTISIGSGCNNVGTILHELMHAVGFFHEQTRSDRDKYVRINWENILEGFSSQFDKYSWQTLDNLGKNYDYKSIMHYDRRAFTKDGKPTIVAIGNEQMEFGTKNRRLSAGDIIDINTLYHCTAKQYGWSRWSGFTPCDEKCYRYRERFCYNPGNLQFCGGNTNVYGIEKDKVKCTKRECVASTSIHGHWGRWSDWSECSVTCGDGVKTRFRKCNNPRPGKNGKPCAGQKNENGVCTLKRCYLGFDDTGFENLYRPLGMWKNKPGSQIKWRINKGYTKTMETGPSRDHTSGYGYYLYIESSAARRGYQAKLMSPLMTSKSGGQCLKFYYSMYGRTTGSLEVKLRHNGRHARLFYRHGDQGINWHSTSITLDFPTMPGFQLEIIATVGQTGYSDIAIDDVYIDDGKCSCQDKYVTCSKWSRKGECQKNKKWMADHCQRSCKICNDHTSVTTPTANCKDSNKVQCPLWAKKGECSKNKAWMHKNCAKSCNKCIGTNCSDNNKNCAAWAKMGECKKNPLYMKVHCKKSCGKCQ